MSKERKIYIAGFALLFVVVPVGLGQLVSAFGQVIIQISNALHVPLLIGRIAITYWYAKHSGSRNWVSLLFAIISLTFGGAIITFAYLVLRREGENAKIPSSSPEKA